MIPDFLIQKALSVFSPSGQDARLSAFIFHRVLSAPDPLLPDEPDARRFDQILSWIRAWFTVLPLGDAIQKLRNGDLPPRAAVITFDDGYADNYLVALPILRKHGLSATFFIATGYLDGGRMWNDTILESIRNHNAPQIDLTDLGLGCYPTASSRDKLDSISALLNQVKYIPPPERLGLCAKIADTVGVDPASDLMMTSEQVRKMRQSGMLIGAHTVSHPILTKIPLATAQSEITASKATLESLLDEPVHLFAYPNGKPGTDYDESHARIVKAAGFAAAVSTAWGYSTRNTNPYHIPRYTPWNRTRSKFALRLMANLAKPTSATTTLPLTEPD